MSLRKKTFLIGSLTIVSLLVSLYALSRWILLSSFARLETDNTRQDVGRALDALAAELSGMENTARDYAAWDDTYAYLAGEYPAYPEDNFIAETFANLQLNLIVVRDCAGENLFQRAFDRVEGVETPLPAGLAGRLAENPLFECGQDTHRVVSGVLDLPGDPLLLVAHPVVTSAYGGPPLGLLIFGRYLDESMLRQLAETTHLPIRLSRLEDEGLASGEQIQVRPLDGQTIAGFGRVEDLSGEPALVLRLDLPRAIHTQGLTTLGYFMGALVVVGLLFAGVALFPLENLLLSRLARLNADVGRIGAGRAAGARLDESGRDELASLAGEINRMLAALERSEQQLRAVERRSILRAIPDQLLVLTRAGEIVEFKTDQERFLERPVAAITGRTIRDFGFSEGTLAALNACLDRALETGEVQTFEKTFFLQERYDYEFRMVALQDETVLVIARDITERKRAEALLQERTDALRESEERYTLAVQGANDGLWDWDLRAQRVYFSPRWKAMLGCAEGEIGDSPDEWLGRVHPEDLEGLRVSLSKHLQGLAPHFESEHRIRHRDGSYRWVLARGLAVRSGPAGDGQRPAEAGPEPGDGRPAVPPSGAGLSVASAGAALRMAGSLTDITARKQAEEQLLHDAFHDALTGLPNRALFMDRLGRAIERARRHPDLGSAVLFLDLDRFKVINDSLGHNLGDQLLIALARRLSICLRASDTVARLGGDEFVLLLEDLLDSGDAARVAARLQEELKLPFDLAGSQVFVTASIGIVASLKDYDQPADVLRDADLAMYRAKSLGKARYELFDTRLRKRAVARLELESELRGALERGEFQLHYQPIQSLADSRLNGFEALLRWNSPSRGPVPPAEFIPVAEETGLILPIGQWVLQEACRQLRRWQTEFPQEPPLTVNVNISGLQFDQPQFCEQVQAVLEETRLEPHTLKLEITETVFMESAGHKNEMLLRLRELGVQLQIDDFGTGYSSLAYLQNFPIHTIKIDRSFIQRIGAGCDGNGSDGEIVKTIVALARDLGMEAVAEGVETQEQLDQLKELDCHFGQGYFFARPMNPDATERLLFADRGQPAGAPEPGTSQKPVSARGPGESPGFPEPNGRTARKVLKDNGQEKGSR